LTLVLEKQAKDEFDPLGSSICSEKKRGLLKDKNEVNGQARSAQISQTSEKDWPDEEEGTCRLRGSKG
jgi:hypothetical protein